MIETPSIIRLRKTEKHSFVCMVRPTVHTNPSRKPFSWRIRDVTVTILGNAIQNKGIWKRRLCVLVRTKITVWEWSFSKTPARVFLKQKSKRSADCCVFKIFRRSVDWAWETVIPVVTIVCSKRDGRELELNLRWEHKKRKRLKCESRRFQQVGSLIPWYPVSTETRW